MLLGVVQHGDTDGLGASQLVKGLGAYMMVFAS